MTIQSAIEKAIAGDFKTLPKDSQWYVEIMENGDCYAVTAPRSVDSRKSRYLGTVDGIVLKPAFWQALGKTEGWETQFDEDKGFNHQWLHNWHRLIDHLAEGGTIETYFEKL